MPPTHSSQAAVAAAYRTLIAHETESKEQDFYRTRLQRLEQATEPVCEFDCRSRVAAAGVGIYCPQCSAKCAETDLATELAIQQIEGEAAWWRSIDFDRNASRTFESMTGDSQQAVRTGVERVLAYLQSTGRLLADDEMRLTAELAEDLRMVLDKFGFNRVTPAVVQAIEAAERLNRALFPATEPTEVNGNICTERNSSTLVDEGRESGGQMDRYTCTPAPAEPAEEETKAEEPTKFRKKPVEVEAMQYDGKDWRSIAQWMAANGAPMGRTASGLLRIHTLEGEMNAHPGDWIIKGTQGEFYPCKPAPFSDTFAPASSPVVPAPTETGPWHAVAEIPKGVACIKDRQGDVWRRCGSGWEHGALHDPVDYSPFVAVDEERA